LPSPIEHRIPIGERGHLLIHENRPATFDLSSSQAAVMLLHGLGSSHAGTFMTSLASRLVAQGHRVFRVDLPGAGRSYRTTPLPPHGACSPEIGLAFEYLSDTLEIGQWRAAGVSLGGNILLKFLSQMDQTSPHRNFEIVRAVAAAPPIDLAACADNMERGLRQIYARYFLRALRSQSIVRARIWPQWAERLSQASFKTIRQFDESMTAPLAGFRDASDYYEQGSSHSQLQQIRTPTVILVDQHDPIVPSSIFETVTFSESTKVVWTKRGGHVGYLHRPSRVDQSPRTLFHRWMDDWIVNELVS
jgi:uncharacterized protein